MKLEEIGVSPPPAGPADWNDDGVVIIPGFFDVTELIRYRVEWAESHNLHHRMIHDMNGFPTFDADRPGGWPDTCPYMRHPALMELTTHPRLAQTLKALVGDAMGVNLILSGWVSTERDWHADTYLNEPEVGDWYAAIWIALADIHPDAGVFQYVPGSHRWPQITREIIGRYYDLNDPAWPKKSEGILTEMFEQEIEARGAEVRSHVPKAGDLLIWHTRLLHRGSRPNRPEGMERIARPALIAHYSGVNHRPRMPAAVQSISGGWYFPIITKQPVDA